MRRSDGQESMRFMIKTDDITKGLAGTPVQMGC
jgi:hypothetical protein